MQPIVINRKTVFIGMILSFVYCVNVFAKLCASLRTLRIVHTVANSGSMHSKTVAFRASILQLLWIGLTAYSLTELLKQTLQVAHGPFLFHLQTEGWLP